MKKIPCFMFIILFFVCNVIPILAMEPIELNRKNLSGLAIGRSFDYLVDATNSLGIDDMQKSEIQSRFIRSTEPVPSFGYTSDVYWLRFQIKNTTTAPISWYLEYAFFGVYTLQLFVPGDDGRYLAKFAGTSYINKRDIKHVTHVFSLQSKPGEQTWYMKIHSGGGSMQIPVKLWSMEKLFSQMKLTRSIMAMFYGILITMMLYNLFIYISVRESRYLYYLLHTLFLFLQSLFIDGYLVFYFPSLDIAILDLTMPLVMLSAFTGIQFTRYYLETKINTPRFDARVLVPLCMLQCATAIAFYPVTKLVQTFTTEFCTVLVLASVVIGMSAGVYYSYKRVRAGYFYFTAYTSLLAGASILAFKDLGIIPNNMFTMYGYHIGTIIMLLLFSLGLADKINAMRKSLIAVSRDLEQNERMAKERAEYLEGVVKTISETSTELVAMGDELKAIGDKLAEMSEEEASSTEEMSSAFEELTASIDSITHSTVEQNREVTKTQELIGLLNLAQDKVNAGNDSVIASVAGISKTTNDTEGNLRQMIDKMNVISAGGKSIGNFISIIDDISDKINLLSLNAAIEAARAGDAGRGFAVVADEIGKLAAATSDNSKEISREISKITRDIDDGMAIVRQTKNSTESVFKMVGAITTQTESVKTLMHNQAQALGDVIKQSEFISAMSKDIAIATREQGASMEETLGMIERLSEMAQELANYNHIVLKLTQTIIERAHTLDQMIRQSI